MQVMNIERRNERMRESRTENSAPTKRHKSKRMHESMTEDSAMPITSLAIAAAPIALQTVARIPCNLRTELQKRIYVFGRLRWQSWGLNEVDRHALLERVAEYEEKQCSYDEVCEVFQHDLGQSYQIFPSDAWREYVHVE